MTTTATMRALDEDRGAVRVEDLYDTDVHDLWDACTTPERLARWIAQAEGDLRVGGTVHVVFTSTWTGSLRVEVCEAPYHLLLTTQPGTDEEGQIEVWLTEEGSRTRLVIEERGLPLSSLPFHASGWQAHVEDLGRSLELGGPVHADGWSSEAGAPAWKRRWEELTPTYAGAMTEQPFRSLPEDVRLQDTVATHDSEPRGEADDIRNPDHRAALDDD